MGTWKLERINKLRAIIKMRTKNLQYKKKKKKKTKKCLKKIKEIMTKLMVNKNNYQIKLSVNFKRMLLFLLER